MMSDGLDPSRGDVWIIDFGRGTTGHEQSGERPALIISADMFNCGQAGLLIVLPITKRRKGIRSHVNINPPEGGLTLHSTIMCEQVRAVDKSRLVALKRGVSPATMRRVEDNLQMLLDLPPSTFGASPKP